MSYCLIICRMQSIVCHYVFFLWLSSAGTVFEYWDSKEMNGSTKKYK